MKTTNYVIGKFKAGQDFAENLSGAFSFEAIWDAQKELIRMWKAWEDKPRDEKHFDFTDEIQIRMFNNFTDDVWTFAIFKIKDEEDTLITRFWGSRNFKSNQI